MTTLDPLIEAIQLEARRLDFPLDTTVYERSSKEPTRPILCAGALDAKICVFGRDLGKDEIAQGQPMVGAAGRLVRQGLCRAFDAEPDPQDRRLDAALRFALLTNTVPYKPPGNKAYAEAVKTRFRPFVAELLTVHWQGDRVLSLGTEAFQWFARYAKPEAAKTFWARPDRYEAELPCTLVASVNGHETCKAIILAPLPHPSPLNQRWYKQFPALLDKRLAGF